MDSIQRLRARAQAADKLKTTKEQKVTVKTEDGKQVIAIEQTSPETVYVPYYDPSVVYGDWPYPAYPPLYFPPPAGFVAGAAFATGVAFGAGIAVGRAISWNYWRGGLGWGRNTIVNVDRTNINNIRVSHLGAQSRASPRGAIPQRCGQTEIRQGDCRLGQPAARFPRPRRRAGAQAWRRPSRHRFGRHRRSPSRRPPGVGDRPGAGDRPRRSQGNAQGRHSDRPGRRGQGHAQGRRRHPARRPSRHGVFAHRQRRIRTRSR